jgi:hypothetical protein
LKEVQFFDTFNKNQNIFVVNEDYISYSYDIDGNIIKNVEKKEVNKENILLDSKNFENFLKQIK